MASFPQLKTEVLKLSNEQKYAVTVDLLNVTPMHYLRVLYDVIKQLLSFDIISQLPVEISKIIFSFLDVSSLCAAGACCRKWREIANADSLWKKLCQYKNFSQLSYFPASTSHSVSSRSKSSSPTASPCHWKKVFAKAFTLQQNWRKGKYSLHPILRGHKKTVTSIACEGKILVSGSADNTVRVWSLESLECLHVLERHTDAVNEVIMKGGLIITACNDGLVRVFDAKSGQYLKSLHGHSGSVEHVACNGRVIISGGSDCLVKVWEIPEGRIKHTMSGHTEDIECLWLSEGHMAISGSWDCTMRVWDIDAGICKLLLMSHTEVVYCCVCVKWRLVSGGGDHNVKVWDLESGNMIRTLTGHKQEVLCLQCSSDLIASASADSSIRLWNYTGVCLNVLNGHIGIVRCLHMKGNILVSGGDRKRIIVWDIETGEQLHTVYRQKSLLHRMCVTDTQIITASPDSPGTVSIVNYY